MSLPTTADNRRPVTESAERFLRAIVDEVPRERLAELHLFTALRQGVYETGVAVLAVWPDSPEGHVAPEEGGRHTVFTARYRLVVKGPDRGRWEFECVAEADAPLITVEMVVRGVQRRSGDLDDPVRYDAEALTHVLRLEPMTAASEEIEEIEKADAPADEMDVVSEQDESEQVVNEDVASEQAASEHDAGEPVANEPVANESDRSA